MISSHNLSELEKLCGSVIQLDKGTLKLHRTLDADDSSGMLTLMLAQGTATDDVITLANSLTAVNSVFTKSANELVIEYDTTVSPALDVELLSALHEHSIQYRTLQKGLSLEDQLYR